MSIKFLRKKKKKFPIKGINQKKHKHNVKHINSEAENVKSTKTSNGKSNGKLIHKTDKKDTNFPNEYSLHPIYHLKKT